MASTTRETQVFIVEDRRYFVDAPLLKGATNPILGEGVELVLTSVTKRAFEDLALPIIQGNEARSWSCMSTTEKNELTKIFTQIGLSDRLQKIQAAQPDECEGGVKMKLQDAYKMYLKLQTIESKFSIDCWNNRDRWSNGDDPILEHEGCRVGQLSENSRITYIGCINDQGLPHGDGVSFHSDGSKFVGQHVEGHYEGEGLFRMKCGEVFWGTFKFFRLISGTNLHQDTITNTSMKDLIVKTLVGPSFKASAAPKEEEDKIRKPTKDFGDGCTYAGPLEGDGYPDGKGDVLWPNGSSYDGEWKRGVFHGQGTFKVGRDRKVEITGTWEANRCNQGACLNCQESVTGNMYALTKHAVHCGVTGLPPKELIEKLLKPKVRIDHPYELKVADGKEFTVDGDVVVFGKRSIGYNREYIGMLRKSDNLPHGWGIMIWGDGSRYEGESRQGSFTGIGIFTVPNGRTSFTGFWEKSEAKKCPCNRCNRFVSGPPRELMNHAVECKASGSTLSPLRPLISCIPDVSAPVANKEKIPQELQRELEELQRKKQNLIEECYFLEKAKEQLVRDCQSLQAKHQSQKETNGEGK